MRILTVRQPWAWAIIHGGKNVENRVRNIAGDYRGPVLIHAALRVAADGANEVVWGAWIDSGDSLVKGAIIGVVDLVAVHSVDSVGCMAAIPDCSPWAEKTPGMHHLRFENPRALDEPIPYTGALGLRKTDFGIEGYWLVEYHEPCKSPCAGVYGCPSSCHMEPVARLVATS